MFDVNILEKCYEDYKKKLNTFEKIENYYYGNTDALSDFKPRDGRSNLKITANFVQKFVDEETSYSFGNNPTYLDKSNDQELMDTIEYYFNALGEGHTSNCGLEAIKMGHAFELSYIKPTGESTNEFKCKVISPLQGYVYKNQYSEIEYFLHIYQKEFDEENTYIDVWDSEKVYHCDEDFNISSSEPHKFGFVPVGVAEIDKKRNGSKTIYSIIKSIQDAFNTNLSDISCEISDFRNAILVLIGIDTEKDENGESKAPILRNNSILGLEDKNLQDAKWLIKNINDTFIKNTLDRQEDLMYSLTAHIDNNEKMQSNLSGIALRSRLTQLEQKCRNNEKAVANLLRSRLKCLFRYLEITNGKNYDVNNIKIQFTPNIPQDITNIADALSKVPHEVLSNKSKTAMIPTVTNVEAEQKQIALENRQELDNIEDLDNLDEGDPNEIE